MGNKQERYQQLSDGRIYSKDKECFLFYGSAKRYLQSMEEPLVWRRRQISDVIRPTKSLSLSNR